MFKEKTYQIIINFIEGPAAGYNNANFMFLGSDYSILQVITQNKTYYHNMRCVKSVEIS